MKLQTIFLVTRGEFRRLGRQWTFWFLALLGIAGVVWDYMYFQGGFYSSNGVTRTPWAMVALPSSVPFWTAYLLSFVNTFILLFCAGNCFREDETLDSGQVFAVKPVSNEEYCIGKFIGTIARVLLLDTIPVAIIAILHLSSGPGPFDFLYYIFYMFTLLLPAIVCLTGFVFFIKRVAPHDGMAAMGGLIILYAAYLLARAGWWTTDILGHYIPNTFSRETITHEWKPYLLQRAWIMAIGGIFLHGTIAKLTRVPNLSNTRKRAILKAAIALVAGGILLAPVYLEKAETRKTRKAYRESIPADEHEPAPRVKTHDISCQRKGETLQLSSRLTLVNRGKNPFNSCRLYLNPGLKVREVSVNGKEYSFSQQGLLVNIPHPLAPGDSCQLNLRYEGIPDERACYLDIPEEEYEKTEIHPGLPYRVNRKYGYTGKDLLLLTPEWIWYPVTRLPASKLHDRQFSRYSLHVKGETATRVHAQGKRKIHSKQEVSFSGFFPSISLHVGKMESKTAFINGITFEIRYLPGHDFFSKRYTREDLKKALALSFNPLYQGWSGLPERLTALETPVSFFAHLPRPGKNYNNLFQPELLFYGEYAYNHNIVINREKYLQAIKQYRSYHIPLFWQLFHVSQWGWYQRWFATKTEKPKLFLNTLFFDLTHFMTSEEFPFMNEVFRHLKKEQTTRVSIYASETHTYLNGHSLQEAYKDPSVSSNDKDMIIRVKAKELMLSLRDVLTIEEWNKFTSRFYAAHRYREIRFEDFANAFQKQYNFDLLTHVRAWATNRELPYFRIKDIKLREVVGEHEGYQVHFKIWNPSNKEGTCVVEITTHHAAAGFGTIAYKIPLVIPAGSCREYRLYQPTTYYVTGVNIHTGVAKNNPGLFSIQRKMMWAPGWKNELEKTSDTTSRYTLLDTATFTHPQNEFVVDNRDTGFRIVEETRLSLLERLQTRYSKNETYPERARTWQPTSGFTLYGDTIQDALFRRARNKGAFAEWKVNLPKAGTYEVFIHNVYGANIFTFSAPNKTALPKYKGSSGVSVYNFRDFFQLYTIQDRTGEQEFKLFVQQESPGQWVSAGRYSFDAGEAKVILHDKSLYPDFWIVADAVKWVRINIE